MIIHHKKTTGCKTGGTKMLQNAYLSDYMALIKMRKPINDEGVIPNEIQFQITEITNKQND